MNVDGMSAVSDFLGDFIAYRNLRPVDPRLPNLDDLRGELELPAGVIPRKNEVDYARVVAQILRRARVLESQPEIQRIVFIGDTRLLDATAFTNICAAGGWDGIAFIGSENKNEAKYEVESIGTGQQLYLSNRWSALDSAFPCFVAEKGLDIDDHTALLIDLDKTTIGARGRNSATIDHARVQAVFETVSALLGELFDEKAFRHAYDRLIQPEFHSFTEDNQDNVAYICLILGSGQVDLETLVEAVRSGQKKHFRDFISEVNTQKDKLPSALQGIHTEIFAYVQAGDPTPFKPFRYNEYCITIAQMGFLPGDTPVERLLAEEIVITREVRDLALSWKAKGALIFGLSDKPDEASIPTSGLATQGFVPLHRKMTHVLGE
jgi:hypothetical protein